MNNLVYLSAKKTPEENFNLIVNNNVFTTKGYERVCQKSINSTLHKEIDLLQTTVIAMGALGIFVAAVAAIVPGVILFSASVIPWIFAKQKEKERNLLLAEDAKEIKKLAAIVNDIILKLAKIQSKKEEFIIRMFNLRVISAPKDETKKNVQIFSKIFDEGRAEDLSGSKIAKYSKEFTKWHRLAGKGVSMQTVHHFNNWTELTNQCFLFLYGKGTMAAKKHLPYVQLKKNGNGKEWVVGKY